MNAGKLQGLPGCRHLSTLAVPGTEAAFLEGKLTMTSKAPDPEFLLLETYGPRAANLYKGAHCSIANNGENIRCPVRGGFEEKHLATQW